MSRESENSHLFPRQVVIKISSDISSGLFPASGCAVMQIQFFRYQLQLFHEPVKVKFPVHPAKLDAASNDNSLTSFRLLPGIVFNCQVYRAGNNPSVHRELSLEA